MPFVLLEHVYVDMVLEDPCGSLIRSCVAEDPFGESYIFIVDYIQNERDDIY